MPVFLFYENIIMSLPNQLKKKNVNFTNLLKIIIYLHDQSQKNVAHFRNNMLCSNFIEHLQNHSLFQQSLAKIVYSLKIP